MYVNIYCFLFSSLSVNWIHLGCGQNDQHLSPFSDIAFIKLSVNVNDKQQIKKWQYSYRKWIKCICSTLNYFNYSLINCNHLLYYCIDIYQYNFFPFRFDSAARHLTLLLLLSSLQKLYAFTQWQWLIVIALLK